jgi:hypothetical protein
MHGQEPRQGQTLLSVLYILQTLAEWIEDQADIIRRNLESGLRLGFCHEIVYMLYSVNISW